MGPDVLVDFIANPFVPSGIVNPATVVAKESSSQFQAPHVS